MSNQIFFLVFNPTLGMVARGLDAQKTTTNIEDAAQANYAGAKALVRVLGEGEWAMAEVCQEGDEFHWVGSIHQANYGWDQLRECLNGWKVLSE